MFADDHSIEAWQVRVDADPEAATRYFLDQVSAVSKDTRKAALIAIPDAESLNRQFGAASTGAGSQLRGIPYVLKDLYDVGGLETRCGSTFLHRVRPAPLQSGALHRAMVDAGAVFAGKTQLQEFACGLEGQNPHYGDCPHPAFPDRLCGGSSSGSAWAVRQGIVPFAFGSDTGGSVRVPAAFCGIYGLRLTPGDPWIADGAFPLSPTLDTAGWFTRSARDMETTLTTLLRPDPGRVPVRGAIYQALDDNVEYELRDPYRKLLDALGLEPTELFSSELAFASREISLHYSALAGSEAADVHKNWLDRYRDEYDPIVWKRIDAGRKWPTAAVEAARRSVDDIQHLFEGFFKEFDYLAMPATPIVAPVNGLLRDELRALLLRFTAPGSFSGRPILTVPVHLQGGLSGGIQFIYKSPREATPIRILESLGLLSSASTHMK